jgi:hypothetical protein
VTFLRKTRDRDRGAPGGRSIADDGGGGGFAVGREPEWIDADGGGGAESSRTVRYRRPRSSQYQQQWTGRMPSTVGGTDSDGDR